MTTYQNLYKREIETMATIKYFLREPRVPNNRDILPYLEFVVLFVYPKVYKGPPL